MSDVSILLVDDHTLVRAGLRALIESFNGFRVVAEASEGREAVRLARELNPAIALVDIAMPGLNGLDAAALMVKQSPNTQVIILSMHVAEHYVLDALQAGAAGFVTKDAAVDELEHALRAVCRGERWLSPAVSRYLFDEYLRLSRHPAGTRAGLGVLTPRQREILQLIAEGQPVRVIAERLSISVKTVETHRAQLMKRLDIHDVAGLTRFAIRIGLVNPEI